MSNRNSCFTSSGLASAIRSRFSCIVGAIRRYYIGYRRTSSSQKPNIGIGAFIIRIEFWGILYYKFNIPPPNSIGDSVDPYVCTMPTFTP